MKIVINKIPIIIKKKNYKFDKHNFDFNIVLLDPNIEYSGKVFVKDASIKTLNEILKYSTLKQKKGLSFYVQTHYISKLKEHIRKNLKIVSAAGGLVLKDSKVLMIYRLQKWDLPKGKIEEGESKKEAAVREVEEECGVKAILVSKLIKTHHTFYVKEKFVIKETHWYLMNCIDDSRMLPQVEEGIEKVEWKMENEIQEALNNTFPNIKSVIDSYYQN